MASSLDDLLNIKGVVAAGEFGLDGSLVDYKASVESPEELAQTTAKFTAAVTQLLNVLAESFTGLNNQIQLHCPAGLGVRRRGLVSRRPRQPRCFRQDC